MKNTSKFARSSLAALGLLAFAGAVPAFAADAITNEEPPAPAPSAELPVASWAGPYAGLSAGYGFAGRTKDRTLDNKIETDGFIGGAFAGYQWQNDNFVYGLEGDINYNGMSGSNAGEQSRTKIDGSLRARLGYAVTPDVLLYGTAGGAAERLKISDAAGSDSNSMLGWTVGAGADVKITEQLFGRVEYRYSDYGSKDFDTGAGVSRIKDSDHRITFGVGMKF
ncbi:MAG: porin family protein [Rhizobiales bacterium]|nr:porin family protein [Hyphomicrobiales bacterium]